MADGKKGRGASDWIGDEGLQKEAEDLKYSYDHENQFDEESYPYWWYGAFLESILEGTITKGVPEYAAIAIRAYEDHDRLGLTGFGIENLRKAAREGFFAQGTDFSRKTPYRDIEDPRSHPWIFHAIKALELYEESKDDFPLETVHKEAMARAAILLGTLEGIVDGRIRFGQPTLHPIADELAKRVNSFNMEYEHTDCFLNSRQIIIFKMTAGGFFSNDLVDGPYKEASKSQWSERV